MTDTEKLRPLLEKQEAVRDVIREQFISALVDDIESGGDDQAGFFARMIQESPHFTSQTKSLAEMYHSAKNLTDSMKFSLDNLQASQANEGESFDFDF